MLLGISVISLPLIASQDHQHHPPAAISATAAAQVREVAQALAPLATPDAARAAGFEPALGWMPMMGTHWVHGPRMLAGRPGAESRLAPSQLMFSLVDGKETLVGAAYAYYAPAKEAAPPVLFDGAPAWHDHPDLAPPGTSLVMLHVWFVPSPDGPFAGLNPFLPYWAAGVTPPPADRLRDPAVSRAVRTGALALAEIVDPAGLFPRLARRPATKPVLDTQRTAVRALVPQLVTAGRTADRAMWDRLLTELGGHWTAMRDAYLAAALDPEVRAAMARAIDEMVQGGHAHRP
jgi:hypothetical protein